MDSLTHGRMDAWTHALTRTRDEGKCFNCFLSTLWQCTCIFILLYHSRIVRFDFLFFIYSPSGLAYGISLGMRESNHDGSLKGAMGILFGLNVITFLPIMYMSFFLNAVTDSYKYLNFAGVQNGLAFMMIVWTFFFTMLNEDVESELNSVVIKTIVNAAVGGDDNMSTEGGEDFVPVEESEF